MQKPLATFICIEDITQELRKNRTAKNVLRLVYAGRNVRWNASLMVEMALNFEKGVPSRPDFDSFEDVRNALGKTCLGLSQYLKVFLIILHQCSIMFRLRGHSHQSV